MARYHDQALVLKTNPYRDTSLLVSLLTREHGRLTAIQQGVRGKSKKQPMAPFQVVELGLVGRSSLLTVSQVDISHRIELSPELLPSGFYVLELISRATHEGAVEQGIFPAAVSCLTSLASDRFALRRFERCLLDELGYGLDFVEADSGELLDPKMQYQYVAEAGFLPAKGEGTLGSVLAKIAAEHYEARGIAGAARKLYQTALIPLIGPEPLVSRSLLQPESPSGSSQQPGEQ